MFYSVRGDAPLGIEYQEEAFDAAEKLQDSDIMVNIGANLCLAYDYAGEYRKIVKIAPKLISLLENKSEKFDFFEITADMHPVLLALNGHALSYLGEFAQGEKESERALILAQQADNAYSLGMVEFLYGCQYLPKGDGENAVRHLRKGTEYFEKLHVVMRAPWSLLAMGYNLLGKSDKALESVQKGLEVQTSVESSGFLSLGHLAMSSVYLNSGNLDEAKVYAEQALNLGQRNHEKYCEAQSWIQLGRVIGKLEGSKIEEAEEYVLKGMKILQDLELKPAYAMGCFSLCELYFNFGRIEQGLEALKRSEEMFSRMGMDHWAEKARDILAKMQ